MPTDELWLELAELELSLGDGIWDGATPPDDAPTWSHRVTKLIGAARGPAAPDELEREDEIVADMVAVTSGSGSVSVSGDEERPRPHLVRAIGGVAAVKVAAAVVTALGAAAATTGLVVTFMAPKAGTERPPVGTSTIESPGTSTDARTLDGRPSDSCAVVRVDCSSTTTAGSPATLGADGQGQSPAPTPDDPTTSSTTPSSTTPTAPSTPSTSAATQPSEPSESADTLDAPGNSGSAPGRPDSPGNSASAPGHSGSAPGNSGSAPGHTGSAPGRSESPGNSGSAPGHSGSPPGRPESPGNSASAPGRSGQER